MKTLIALLPLALCGGAMALCMWLMGRGHAPAGKRATEARQADAPPADMATRQEVAELHEEVTRLRAELRLAKEHEPPERGR